MWIRLMHDGARAFGGCTARLAKFLYLGDGWHAGAQHAGSQHELGRPSYGGSLIQDQ